jgi:predicted small integral membrane protein
MLDWMAWTTETATFFAVIACLLVIFTLLAIKYPETPRVGVLRIETCSLHFSARPLSIWLGWGLK